MLRARGLRLKRPASWGSTHVCPWSNSTHEIPFSEARSFVGTLLVSKPVLHCDKQDSLSSSCLLRRLPIPYEILFLRETASSYFEGSVPRDLDLRFGRPRSDADLLSKSTFMTYEILANPILTHHSSHLCSQDSFEPRAHRRPEDPRSRDPFEPRARKPSSRCVMRYLLRGSQPDTNPSFEVRAEQTNPLRDSCSSERQHPLSRLLAPQLVNDLSMRPRTRCSHE